MKRFTIILAIIVLVSSAAWADDVTLEMFLTTASGAGASIGTVTVTDTPYGALFTPALVGLVPGLHGFHVHGNPECGPKEKDGARVPGLAARGHYDPAGTGRHEGPYGDGHLGDLPPLYVDDSGQANHPVLAPRLKAIDLKGRSLMIHAGGDNYSDHPAKLGGGGARMACGVLR